jgi:hydroxylamine reductase
MFRITENTKIGELLRNMPEAAEILAQMGMHCPTCPSAQNETLEEACDVHDMDVEALIEDLKGFLENM